MRVWTDIGQVGELVPGKRSLVFACAGWPWRRSWSMMRRTGTRMGKSDVQAVEDVTRCLGSRWGTWRSKVDADALRSFGRWSSEGLRRVKRYGRCFISGRFRDIGKPVFGRVSGPLILGRDRIVCSYR